MYRFRRDGLVLKNARPEPANCYGIAHVFTLPEHRRRGYAKHMMNLLHWVIAPQEFLPQEFPTEWGSRPQRVPCVTPGAFSVLYSDVGSKFYRLCGTLPNQDDGWIVDGLTTTHFDVVKTHQTLSSREKGERLLWRWLDEASVREAWNADVGYMEEEMFHSSNRLKPVAFTFLPDKGVANSNISDCSISGKRWIRSQFTGEFALAQMSKHRRTRQPLFLGHWTSGHLNRIGSLSRD